MRYTFRPLAGAFLLLSGLLSACSSDQIEHIRNGKKIAIVLENMTVKRIMPTDLLRATRWAGDSLTAHADRELRRVLSTKLDSGGLAAALPYCRPETYAAVDSLARVLEATPRRLSQRPRNPRNQADLPPDQLHPDTVRLVSRLSAEQFSYQRPIILNDQLCLRCHGQVGKDISAADYALIKKQYPTDKSVGFRLGEPMGVWRVQLQRSGVAEFYTMKTRKIMKPRPKLF
ncbi:hypothetical protein SAMN00120144_0789 [Hymenobacter roseosalivarius DSM 11622]|uniref:Tll0287-like domain-containing protein n=1 Tax=Hymenobacter roseosalivarius DSM 11622 TaxID=645990 RepID=A0A1W1US85_9BACT|nr:DUF3365 domain-containing protein [Hymenobacter roseosalivarius]SMB83893.1 hypothetical protein SAMN00120144_0789 [Hymenobacter roseosalivarius DSM 11622]